MSLISEIGRKTFKNRCIMAAIYLILSIMGITMVVPFLITVTGSTSNDFDYNRFSPVPRYLWSKKDRFVKGLVPYFNTTRNWQNQFRAYAPEKAEHWQTWTQIGISQPEINAFAERYGGNYNKIAAADYAEFCAEYPLSDCFVYAAKTQTIAFIIRYYSDKYRKLHPDEKLSSKALQTKALDLLSAEWELPFNTFYSIGFDVEMRYPMDQQGWFPNLSDNKYKTYLAFQEAVASHFFTPGIDKKWAEFLKKQGFQGVPVFPVMSDAAPEIRALWLKFKQEYAPASPAIPYAMRANWVQFLASEEISNKMFDGKKMTVEQYNKLVGTNVTKIIEGPFPVPGWDGKVKFHTPEIESLWKKFVNERFPLRLTVVDTDAGTQKKFQEFIRQRGSGSIDNLNKLLDSKFDNFEELHFTERPVDAIDSTTSKMQAVWKDFVRGSEKKQINGKTVYVPYCPYEKKHISCSEIAYQKFLLKKYGSLDAINEAYGLTGDKKLTAIEYAFPAFMDAYAKTFAENEYNMTFGPALDNYKIVLDYLLFNGNAVFVTLLLIAMTIFFTLTINPLAAYALSRFNLRGRDQILIYMLATMAFPAMVSAIPNYLLMRDLGLLNTFWALVLPGCANGMAIFILKGFFDSLPMELFEAATIDGASEMQIFRVVAMPLVKPILAINCLNAFIGAYNGWEWALLICQNRSMWTIAVWLYQANMWWGGSPWIVSAGFVLASIPTFVVFVSCQKVILRGIIIPSMK